MRPVIWVTADAAPEPRGGGALRSNHLISALARVTEVHVVRIGVPIDEAALVTETGVAAVSVFQPPHRPLRSRWEALGKAWPVDFSRHVHPEAVRQVATHVAAGALVVIEHMRLLPYRPHGAPAVLALQNVDSELTRWLAHPTSPPRRVERRWELWSMVRQEHHAVSDPTLTVVTVSDSDSSVLGGETVVIPNGAHLPTEVPPVPDDGSLLFIGTLDYAPNVDAIRWWVEELGPAIADTGRRLTVVGRGGAVALGPLARHPAIDFVGEVDDLSPHLAAALAVVIPIRRGSGTRVKLLEALAWGRPVVTTTKGAEGIPVVDGRHVLVADDAVGIAGHLRHLLRDPKLRARLSLEGRLLAEQYSWEDIGRRFVRVLAERGA